MRSLDEEMDRSLDCLQARALTPFSSAACRIYGRRVNSVAGPDVQDRRIGRQRTADERSSARTHDVGEARHVSQARASPTHEVLKRLLTFFGSDEGSGHAVGGHVPVNSSIVSSLRQSESDRVAHQRPIERSWANRPRQLGAVQLQRHPLMKWIAENVLGQ